MDKEFAIRLVVFEYLLPMQRNIRSETIHFCMKSEGLTVERPIYLHISGIMEDLVRLSDRLMEGHGFPTSYVYPLTYKHTFPFLADRPLVNALVDSNGPFYWDRHCLRKADPKRGFRTHLSGLVYRNCTFQKVSELRGLSFST